MIKKLFYLVVFLCAIFINAQDTMYVSTENLNMRAGAGAQYDVVGVLPQNSKVIHISTEGNWSQVQDEQGNPGYVNTKFLSNSPTTESDNSEPLGFWDYVKIILMLVVSGFLLWLGYYLWKTSIEEYDYNIFGTWVMARMVVAAVFSYLTFIFLGSGSIDALGVVFAIVALIMLVWTFVSTLKKTNLLIACLSFFYQIFLVGILVSVVKFLFRNMTVGNVARERAVVKFPRNYKGPR